MFSRCNNLAFDTKRTCLCALEPQLMREKDELNRPLPAPPTTRKYSEGPFPYSRRSPLAGYHAALRGRSRCRAGSSAATGAPRPLHIGRASAGRRRFVCIGALAARGSSTTRMTKLRAGSGRWITSQRAIQICLCTGPYRLASPSIKYMSPSSRLRASPQKKNGAQERRQAWQGR